MKKLLCVSMMMLLGASAFAEEVNQASAQQAAPEVALASQTFLQGVSLERITPVGGKNKVVVFRVSDDTVCKVKIRVQKLKPQATAQEEKMLIDGPTVCSFEKKEAEPKKYKK